MTYRIASGEIQDFEIKIDPRILSSIPNAENAYAERYEISKSILSGATEMSEGVRDLRKVKQQLDFILTVTNDKKLISDRNDLNKNLDDWIAKILQKEISTQQHNYQFEVRLLIKYKNFLNAIKCMFDLRHLYNEKWLHI